MCFDMNTNRQTFHKTERLCRTKLISEIFEKGEIFYTSHFKVLWIISPEDLPFPAQVAFSVPKKIFRHAVTRNLIKRRLREAYRKNKSHLYDFLENGNKQVAFMLIFRQNSIPDYQSTEKAVKEMIEMLCHNVTRKTKMC